MKKRRCIFRLPFPDSLIRSDSTVSSCIGYETSKFEIAISSRTAVTECPICLRKSGCDIEVATIVSDTKTMKMKFGRSSAGTRFLRIPYRSASV